MELLPIAPTNYYYGETLLTSNDFPNAVKFLETAYQMNDEDPKIAAAYLYALAKVGQLDRAKELWPRVSQMSADFNPDQKKRVETVEKIIRPGR